MDVRLWWNDDVLFNAVQKKINPSGEGVTFNLRKKRDNEPEESKRRKLDPSFLKQIWKPDLFIDGLISTSNPAFIAKPEKLVFRQDGVLVLQSRVSLTISCNMDFHYYPADTQECTFSIRSYAFESHELELEWGSPSPSVYAFDRRNTNFEIQLLEPKLERLVEPSLEEPEVSISWGDTTYTAPQKNETFDVLVFSIRARRRMAYHLVQTYLPSVFFILITWLCFLIPPHMVECRIGITMTTLLTLTAMFASVRESTPVVSYVKAIDIWMIACIFFVFLTLLQFSFVVWLGLNKPPPDEPQEDTTTVSKMNVEGDMEGYELGERLKGPSSSVDKLSSNSVQVRTFRNAIRLERLSILLYVFIFLVFNAIYWPWLFNSSKYFDWVVDPTYNAPDADE